MEPSKRPPPLPPRLAATEPVRTAPPLMPSPRPRILPWVALGGSLLLLTIVSGAVAWRVLGPSSNGDELTATAPADAGLPAVTSEPVVSQPVVAVKGNSQAPILADTTPDAPVIREQPTPTEPTSPPEPNATSEPARSEAPVAAFADLIRRKGILELPGRGLMRDSTEAVLAAVPLKTDEKLQLAMTNPEIKLNRSSDSPDETVWTVIKQAKDAFGGQEDVTLGRFTHRDSELRFQWEAAAPGWTKPASLQFAGLAVTVGKQSQTCQLWKPIIVNPTRIETQAATTLEVPLPADFVDRPQAVHVRFQIAGVDDATLPSVEGALNELAKIMIGHSDSNSIEVELKLTLGDSRSTLQAKLFGSPPHLGKDGEIRQIRQEITPAIVQGHQRQARGKDLKKREVEIDKFRKQIGNLQNQIATKEQAMDNGAVTLRARYQLDINSLNNQIGAIENKLGKLESDLATAQEFTEKMTTWCDEVGGLLKTLEEQAQLRYAVYLETGPRTIIVETSDFEWTKD